MPAAIWLRVAGRAFVLLVAWQSLWRNTVAAEPVALSPAGKIRWEAPKLQKPTTIQLGTGQTSTELEKNRDYIIELPREKKVGVTELIGGRNVVIVGGHISVPGTDSATKPAVKHFAAIHLRHQTGTVHIEGLLIDNSAGGKGWDAFFTNCPQATVQIQNVRVEGLSGDFKGLHADVIQVGGGCGELRVDRLTGTTDYQGIFLKLEENLRGKKRFGPMRFSRVDLKAVPGSFNQALLYLTTPDYYMEGNVDLDDVWLQPVASDPINFIVPRVTPCGYAQLKSGKCDQHHAWKEGNVISWPFFPEIHGSVHEGAPKESFVPAGSVGIGYTSPGVEENEKK
jgi:hypothetical protein